MSDSIRCKHVWMTTYYFSGDPRQAIQECAVPKCGAVRKFTWPKPKWPEGSDPEGLEEILDGK